jgi:hypothetical protein
MRFSRTLAATAMVLATCSLAYAAGPIAPKADLKTSTTAPILVHDTCHRDVRNHDGAYPQHYHRRSSCRMVVVDNDDGGYDDCHHSVLRHYLPGYGKVYHRHRGSNCRVDIYENEGGPSAGVGGCVQIGPSVICGYGAE